MSDYHITTLNGRSVDIPWLIFILATIISLGIAILTVSFQAVRSALGDPVDSIKYE